MKIRITWLATGAVLDLQESDDIIGPQTTFLEIKGFIQMRYGFRPQQLLLVCDQVLAEDEETLKQFGIVSTETADRKVIGCHVFSMEEAEKEQRELEQDKANEAEQKKRDAKKADERKKQKEEGGDTESNNNTSSVAGTEESGEQKSKTEGDEKPKAKPAAATATTSLLSFNHSDYQKALKILGKEKFTVSTNRLEQVANGNAPTHRPKFLDEQKAAKQQQFLDTGAPAYATNDSVFGAATTTTTTDSSSSASPNYLEMLRPSAEWRGREADKLRNIFKFAEYGDRRKEADAFFRVDYPGYEGGIELWDVREDIMASISLDAQQKPLIIELFYFCDMEKGVELHKLGDMVRMKLEQRGLRVKVLGTREAGCTYPLVAVAVTGETPAEIFQLGEVFFEEFGNPNAVTSTEAHGSHSSGGPPVPQEGCSIQ